MDCNGVLAEPHDKVLNPNSRSAACWNFVIDARSLMCSGWQAEAWVLQCSLTNGDCCTSISNLFSEYQRFPQFWQNRIENLARLLGDHWVQLRRSKLDSSVLKNWKLRKMEVLLQEMVAAKNRGDVKS